jgi:hypothetical protein
MMFAPHREHIYWLHGLIKRERKRETRVVVRDTTMCGREKDLSSVLKVPRQCPFVLPVGVKHLTGIRKV